MNEIPLKWQSTGKYMRVYQRNQNSDTGFFRPRPYAFEVSLCLDPANVKDHILIFSKRWLKVWPNINSVANRIDRALASYAKKDNANRPADAIIEVYQCTPN